MQQDQHLNQTPCDTSGREKRSSDGTPEAVRASATSLQQAETLLKQAQADHDGAPRGDHQSAEFGQKLNRIREQSHDRVRLLRDVAAALEDRCASKLVLFCQWGQTEGVSSKQKCFRLAGELSATESQIAQQCESLAIESMRTGKILTRPNSADSQHSIVAVPIPQTRFECLVLLLSRESASITEAVTSTQAASLNVAFWDTQQKKNETEQNLHQIAAIAELVSRMQSCDSLDTATRLLAEQLSRLFGERDVFIGVTDRHNQCRLSAVAGRFNFNRNAKETRLVEDALQEAIDRGDPGQWPPNSDGRHALLALKQLSEHFSSRSLLTFPLPDEQWVNRGVVLIAEPPKYAGEAEPSRYMPLAAPQLGSVLGLIDRAQPKWFRRKVQQLTNFFAKRQGQALLGMLTLCGLAMLIPFPYGVATDVELTPVTRRFVAAPFAAPLERAFFETGEVVQVGDRLADLDGREIRMELAGLSAELHQAMKERAGHLAKHEVGEAEIARLEVERLKGRVALLRERIDHLTIESPIAGVIVHGDLASSEGVPLQQGEVLFEIAPLESMVCELGVRQDEIRHVRQGAPINVRLDAYPEEWLTAKVLRISPQATPGEHETLFIVEAEFENEDQKLRPGMTGRGKIEADQKPLGWILFHRALNAVTMRLGW